MPPPPGADGEEEEGSLLSGGAHTAAAGAHAEAATPAEDRTFLENVRGVVGDEGANTGEDPEVPTKALRSRGACAKTLWVVAYVYVLVCFSAAVFSTRDQLSVGGPACASTNGTCAVASECCADGHACVQSRCEPCPAVGAECRWDGDCCPLARSQPTVCAEAEGGSKCKEVLAPPDGWTYDFSEHLGWATCSAECALDRSVQECTDSAGATVLSGSKRYRGPFVRAALQRDVGCMIADDTVCGLAFLRARPDPDVAILRRAAG